MKQSSLSYSDIIAFFKRLQDVQPDPVGELFYTNAYTLLVAVVLSAQATDAGVNKATKKLFAVADTPQKVLALGEQDLINYIKTIGLYRNKARNIIKLSRILQNDYQGDVPASRQALQSLPGVGRKTANVVLNVWFKHPAQAVDTHVFRVSNRTGLAIGCDVLEVEKLLEDRIPVFYQNHAHHWLILHGRYVCKSVKPLCRQCIVSDLCTFRDKKHYLS